MFEVSCEPPSAHTCHGGLWALSHEAWLLNFAEVMVNGRVAPLGLNVPETLALDTVGTESGVEWLWCC
jgi:hypothetical protein